MQSGPPRRRRARPVADAPTVPLLARTEDLAKGWLLALVEAAPLDEAPGILAADLARDGPRTCAAVVGALSDDAELGRIDVGGPLESLVAQVGRAGGAGGAEASARSVAALQSVIWSAVREELADPDPDQVAELAERLALVIEVVRAAGLRAVAEPTQPVWVGGLEREVSDADRAGTTLALLLAELSDGDRVLAVEGPTGATATFSRLAQAVRGALRGQDTLACEGETRAWIIARDTDRSGAQALAVRITDAVSAAEPWRGAPLVVSVGLAVLHEDGEDATGLIESAEQRMFAAAASGEPPEASGPRLVS